MSDLRTADVPALIVRRTFKAPRTEVFEAWTSANLIRRWFGPLGTTVSDAIFEPRQGGYYRIAMTSSAGEAYNVRGTITEYSKPERLAYTFRWEEEDPELERDTFVSIDFIDRGTTTEVVLKHEGFSDEASRARHEGGWNGALDQLALLAEAAEQPKRAFTITGMDLGGYMVQDAPRAIGFYRDVLGLEPSRLYPDNRGAEYDLADGTTFGLWGGGGKVVPFQPSNGILFRVDDFAGAVAALKKRGIPIIMQNELSGCFMAWINDTEGNSVILHKRK
jgi:uncharacterized protein YndB with AHSA1/START domain/predicted enzyme related to lactoylglutathione lyase